MVGVGETNQTIAVIVNQVLSKDLETVIDVLILLLGQEVTTKVFHKGNDRQRPGHVHKRSTGELTKNSSWSGYEKRFLDTRMEPEDITFAFCTK